MGHAGVLGLQHHADAPGVELRVEVLGDLHGQPLLSLGPGREVLDQAGQFGQPEDALPGQVADVRDAREEQHVMLAEGPEGDGAGQDQLVITFVVGEGGEPERLRGQQFCVGAGHPGWCGPALLAIEVDPERGQEVRGGPLGCIQVHGPLCGAQVHHALPAVQVRSLAPSAHGYSGGVAGCQQR